MATLGQVHRSVAALVALVIGLAWATLGSAQSCAPPRLANLLTGFSVNHFHVEKIECSPGHMATKSEDNILLHYGDKGAPERLIGLLSQMRENGARVMREHIWFRHIEDTAYQPRLDPIGLLVASQGKLPGNDIASLVAIISDAKKLGYKRYVIVLGAQGGANPKCKKGDEFGGCYEGGLDDLTWGVSRQIVQATRHLSSSEFDIVYDIAPESCSGGTKLLVDNILARYERTMASHYGAEFGDNHFIMSCSAGTAVRGIAGLNSVRDLYQELRILPAAIDVHIYELEPNKVEQILEAGDRAASDLGVPLDVNETFYDHPNVFFSINRMEETNSLPALREILVFPLHARSSCQIDVSAPYDIAALNRHLGRLSPSGVELQACRHN